MTSKRKTPFVQSSLRAKLKRTLKLKAQQPYQFAKENGIAIATIYRLLSEMNVSSTNYEKIKNSIHANDNL